MNSSLKKSSVVQGQPKSRSMLVGNTGSSPWYFATLDKDSGFESSDAMFIDSSNNIFLGQGVNNGNHGAVTKLSVNPLTITQNKWVSANDNTNVRKIKTDSSGNIYMAILDDSPNPRRGYLMKTNSTLGTINFQKGLYFNAANSASQFEGVADDSSGNVFGAGYFFKPGSDYWGSIAKYNSSGTLQWQREIKGHSTSQTQIFDCVLDSSGNLYVVGTSIVTSGGQYNGFVAKYNTSGAIQWQRKLSAASGGVFFRKIVVDSTSANIYVTGESGADVCLIAYNSSGTIQWQRKIGNALSHKGRGLAIDTSNNLYITGYGNFGDGVNQGLLIKYNSSGTIQFQRKIAIGTTVTTFGTAAVDTNNYINGGGSTAISGNYYSTFFKLPNDGSATGTYSINGGTIVYSVSTLTEVIGGMTDAIGGLTDASGTQTEITGSLSWSDLTQTLTTTGAV